MRRLARHQAKERNEPETPRKAHRRAVQAAVKDMRQKLYTKRSSKPTHNKQRPPRRQLFAGDRRRLSSSLPIRHPPIRHHPP